MKKICIVLGTRPEAIKLAPVIYELQKQPQFECCIVNVGQHDEMIQQMLEVFSLVPHYDLNLMEKKQSLSSLTAKIATALPPIYEKERPDLVMVQGDTTTAFIGALIAFYHHIPIAHVEAGLRSYHIKSPFPEEMNRTLIGPIADYSFAPTESSKENLLKEGVDLRKIHVVGNTVIDALHYILKNTKPGINEWDKVVEGKKIILMTVHRRENFGTPIDSIFEAIKTLALEQQDVHFIYPVHLNPNVKQKAHSALANLPNVTLTPPLDYIDFLHLMNQSHCILTDSGGIQEEAPVLGKPVLVLRDRTERHEGVTSGIAKIVGSCQKTIYEETHKLLHDVDHYASMSSTSSPYGDGTSSQKIVKILSS